eukprot:GHVU01192874.1.p1 GENE.GHVU01192874.1~~GHVU01192874.1.p1  ORF type:complete len:173 (-),score=11.65 GHVU01192874.1:508-1026(-)
MKKQLAIYKQAYVDSGSRSAAWRVADILLDHACTALGWKTSRREREAVVIAQWFVHVSSETPCSACSTVVSAACEMEAVCAETLVADSSPSPQMEQLEGTSHTEPAADDKVYDVEQIVCLCAPPDEPEMWKVKWRGYDAATWEPRENILRLTPASRRRMEMLRRAARTWLDR